MYACNVYICVPVEGFIFCNIYICVYISNVGKGFNMYSTLSSDSCEDSLFSEEFSLRELNDQTTERAKQRRQQMSEEERHRDPHEIMSVFFFIPWDKVSLT